MERTPISSPRGSSKAHRRLSVNITPVERIGRVVLGALAVTTALVLLGSAGSLTALVLESLLALAGLDLIVTGALGHCPLYHRLGFVPRSLRGEP